MNANEVFFEAESQVGETQMQGHQFKQMLLENALSYLNQVKSTLENDGHFAYSDFLELLVEFKSGSIDLPEYIESLKNLFRGHPELIVGFNRFLPPGGRLEVPLNEQVQEPGTNLGGGATSSLTIHTGGPPTTSLHSTHGSQSNHSSLLASPHSSAGNAGNNVCGNSELESDFHALALETKESFGSSYSS